MAEMLPAIPSGATRSEAELRMFKRFKEDAPADWTVLHSLGLRGHHRKPWAEADFVVINSSGVTVVEVKGGHVRRTGREWFTNDKKLGESPFDQANGAAAALHDDLRTAVPEIRDGLVMAAVAFPQVEFVADGPDLVPPIVYDQTDVGRPIGAWTDRVEAYWRERIDGDRHISRKGLSRAVRAKIVARLAGDFELRPSLRARLGEVESELVRFTEQQAGVMAALSTNPRMLVTGGAGTGKTWLALEEALRAARQGRRALLMCHTKSLAAWLRSRVANEASIDVVHFNGLTTKLIKAVGLWSRFSDADDSQRFRIEHPELALEALCTMADPPLYDVVIVDEAQDMLTVPALDLLDGLVVGGLVDGCWRLFLDPHQDILHGADVAAMDKLDSFRPTRFPLTVNCRNTAEIAMQTAVMALRGLDDLLPVSGPDVNYIEFSDERDQLRRVAALLRGWLDEGVHPSQIVVLGRTGLGRSVLADGLPRGVSAELVESTVPEPAARRIRYSTIANFKGLEADAILLLDAGQLPPTPDSAADLYVAMSRAKVLLAVGHHVAFKPERAELYGAFGARIGARGVRS